MKKIQLLLFIIALLIKPCYSQQKKNIQLEDIWAKGLFMEESFEGLRFLPDDNYYTLLEPLENNTGWQIVKITTQGNQKEISVSSTETMFEGKPLEPDDYEFSPDGNKILFTTQTEHIYRRSYKAAYFVYDIKSKILTQLSKGGKQGYATFSPDSRSIAFVRNNNLFVTDVASSKETQASTDGEYNKIINGSTDWVYEEEFEFAKAFLWSPDSKRLAYYKFDESPVQEYTMQVWGGLYPVDYKYKYPKAGEKNAVVSVHCYDIQSGKTITFNTRQEKDNYIPRIKWTHNSDLLAILRLNRLQNHLEILHASYATGAVYTAYEEKDKAYVEINDDLTYLKDGKHFILTSEKEGYRHIYLYTLQGRQVAAVTKGAWEVTKFLGIDEKNKLAFYTSTEISPLEKHFYSIDLSGKNKKQISKARGTHEITISPQFRFYMDEHSLADVPTVAKVYALQEEGVVATLSENNILKETLNSYQLSPTEFIQFKNGDGTLINASFIKPANFDASKKYPVLIYIYGGPGSQQVKQEWRGPDYGWFQMLAQKGIGVFTIDNRGTGGRGAAYKKATQNQLGKLETEDLIAAARHLGTLPYIDKSRIGVFGWSFGGYMSALGMTLGADFFKAGIAVAPVTSWRFYDSIYTERFLGLPQTNASGYDNNSPLTHAAKLKGSFLLVHGTADDNVHVQNTIELEKALIRANKQFQVFYYPDKNHGIYGGNTRLHLYTLMTNFLEKNL